MLTAKCRQVTCRVTWFVCPFKRVRIRPMTQNVSLDEGEVDELFQCLGHVRCRRLLSVVRSGTTPMTVEELVEGLAADEFEAGLRETASDSSDEIAISLVHSHLPQLQDAGIIDGDGKRKTVTEGDRFGQAMVHLDRV